MRPIYNKQAATASGQVGSGSGRVAAAIVGLPVVGLTVWGAFWALLFVSFAGTGPDATVVDGDPCCPTPDSWGQVLEWSAGAVALSAISALGFAIGVSCLYFAATGRGAGIRVLVWMPAFASVLVTAGLVVAHIVQAIS